MADAPRATLIVFTRAPRLGTVKRRLARDIGTVEASRFHRTCIDRLMRTVGRDRRWRTVLAVTPDETARGAAPWAGRQARQPQGRGDLGARMVRALRRGGPVVIVGSDIPAMRPAHVAAAFRALGHADLIFGPAADGGFWLVGTSGRRPLPPGLFAGVRWSTAHALADARATIPSRWGVACVATLDDVDDIRAWTRWRGDAA
ncbi:MAG: glycosyltransferase [Alphaproteobacteria bacterium]|nr:glycosyltransferase [Alphaproteobacteria bacterium]